MGATTSLQVSLMYACAETRQASPPTGSVSHRAHLATKKTSPCRPLSRDCHRRPPCEHGWIRRPRGTWELPSDLCQGFGQRLRELRRASGSTSCGAQSRQRRVMQGPERRMKKFLGMALDAPQAASLRGVPSAAPSTVTRWWRSTHNNLQSALITRD